MNLIDVKNLLFNYKIYSGEKEEVIEHTAIMFLYQLRKVILSEFLVITDRESQHLQNSLLLY